MAAHDRIQALVDGLAELADEDLDPPANVRVGATLVLLQVNDDHVDILLTRRQANLSSHPGQISFPGGRVDPGETIVEAALREASEEIGVDPSSVTVLGRLPVFYIPPSRYWMSTVVARWDQPHDLVPNEAEVAEILTVGIDQLQDPDVWRSVPLSASGMTWAWDLGGTNLLWGATAVVTSVLLSVMDDRWNDGTHPEHLPVERQVKPWENPEAVGVQATDRRPQARLRDVADVEVPPVNSETHPAEAVTSSDVQAFASDVVSAVNSLVRRPEGQVVVLAGPGRTGDVARVAAGMLRDQGEEVMVVDTSSRAMNGFDDGTNHSAGLDDAGDPLSWRRHSGGPSPDFVEEPVGVVIDGMLGRGFDGPLREPIRSVVRSLARTGAPLIALDLPSGIDPSEGMIGDAASADVTIAVEPLLPAHRGPGVAPFLGDIYISRPGQKLGRAVLVDRPTAWAE